MENQQYCTNCGEFCPGGTLENGLCSVCDSVGKNVNVVDWPGICRVFRVSRNGTLYAQRWFTSKGRWSAERPIHYYNGWRQGRK